MQIKKTSLRVSEYQEYGSDLDQVQKSLIHQVGVQKLWIQQTLLEEDGC